MADVLIIEDKCNQILSYSYGRIAFFVALAIIPFALGIYFLFKLINTLVDYTSIKKDLMNKISMTKVDPMYRSENDNEDYKDPNAETDKLTFDEMSFQNITENIDGSFIEAEDYNKAVEKYWRTVHKTSPIDTIDRSSLVKEHDNW
jgi:hypothetical protein